MNNPRLLVSVRSPEEAEAALAGGADLIDIKEPGRGSLGRADVATMARIVQTVAGRRPISAALGELRDRSTTTWQRLLPCLSFVKWGLSGCRGSHDWRKTLTVSMQETARAGQSVRIVPVAYADARIANAPPVHEVADFACEVGASVLLIDTWDKHAGRTLLDWLSPRELMAIKCQFRDHRVQLALAGSLGRVEIEQLVEVRPDWFAVRSAVCVAGRSSAVSADRVRDLAQLLHGNLQPASIPEN